MWLKPKGLALIISFASLYAVLSLVSLFPVIGAVGAFITLASIIAPLVGIMLGPYAGALAVSIGGFIGWSIRQASPFGFLSFLPGTSTALTAGFLYDGKRKHVVVMYSLLLLSLAFYPVIGPAWLYPYYLWFQLVGLIVLASPLTSAAITYTNKNSNVARLTFGVAILCLLSTLAGQMTGNLMFELMNYPWIHLQIEYWLVGQWPVLTFLYPAERSIITVLATLIGVPLIRTLRTYGFEVGGQ